MAGNANSGRNPTFPHSEDKLDKLIKAYKEGVESGEIPRASWPHFVSMLDCTETEVAEVMALDDPSSAYRNRARALKRMATWIRGQMMSAPAWNGQMTARAIFALKQDVGDGVRWTDQDNGKGGPIEIKVSFGGSDPRAKQASK